MIPNASASPPFVIMPARTPDDLAAVRGLFAAYAQALPIDLDYQDFAAELAALPGKYAAPAGELLVAWDGAGRPVGCVALRPLVSDDACEMKRLYVAPAARSFGLGEALTRAVVEAAKQRGYAVLRLDTLATMAAASHLYQRMGFHRIAAYYHPTPPGTVFMELDLTR